MTLNNEIIVVSGLPRSGTSLMMQMLKNGGVEVVADHLRAADADNPHGYFEFEAVKDLQHDASWLSATRGKAVKIVSLLLYQLPQGERYRVLFMDRDLGEVLRSQETMLRRLNRDSAPYAEMYESYKTHLDHLENWLKERSDVSLLKVGYKDLIEQPRAHALLISEFLGRPLETNEMVKAVEPALYRNRNLFGR